MKLEDNAEHQKGNFISLIYQEIFSNVIFLCSLAHKSRQSFNALSHLPDLLNGTEIDPTNYVNYVSNLDQQNGGQQYSENFSEWGDNLNKVLSDHMKFVPKMSENIGLMNSLAGNYYI